MSFFSPISDKIRYFFFGIKLYFYKYRKTAMFFMKKAFKE